MFPYADSWINHGKTNSECKYWITLQLEMDELMTYAEKLEYEMKLMEGQLKFRFISQLVHKYEPFRSKDIQEITKIVLKQLVNIEQLKDLKVVIDYYNIHDMMAISDLESKVSQTTWITFFKENFRDDCE